MRPLMEDMVKVDPTQRPTIDEVVARFADIEKELSAWTLHPRVIGKQEFPLLSQSSGALVSSNSVDCKAGGCCAGSFGLVCS